MVSLREYPEAWKDVSLEVKIDADWKCQLCGHPSDPENGYMLTVHHIDGNKANCDRDNLIALCQRCHLREQGKLRRGVSPLALEQVGQLRLFERR